MSTRAFSTFTRHAADAVSRRTSLVTLGGAALAATVANPGVSAAKKSGKTCKNKAKKRCKQDVAACRNTVVAECEGDPGCLELLPCCDTCSANSVAICLFA